MKITPITDYKEFHRTKDLPGCDKDILLAEVTERGNPEILSFLPDTDPERMAVQSSELAWAATTKGSDHAPSWFAIPVKPPIMPKHRKSMANRAAARVRRLIASFIAFTPFCDNAK